LQPSVIVDYQILVSTPALYWL